MNAEEFTEPFDLERFIARETIFSHRWNRQISFEEIEGDLIKTSFCRFSLLSAKKGLSYLNECFMKPRDSDGWIKHDGSAKCPIPWAKSGEFQVKFRSGEVCSSFIADGKLGYYWDMNPINGGSDIVAFRLTDGWIYCNGRTIPKEIEGLNAGEWEFRFSDRSICTALFNAYRFTHHFIPKCIVAVRPIKKASRVKSMVIPPSSSDERILDNSQSIIFTPETEKQRLTREAYERYKAAHPEPKLVLQIGEGCIESMIFSALCEEMKVHK